MSPQRRSKLDMTSMVFLVAGFTLFIIAAICYSVAVVHLLMFPGAPPLQFTLGQFGNFAGIGGMLIIPLFIITAIAVTIRDQRREKKTGNDIGTDTKPGAAGRS